MQSCIMYRKTLFTMVMCNFNDIVIRWFSYSNMIPLSIYPRIAFIRFCFFQILALSSSEPFQAPRSLANHAAQASTKPVSWTSPIVLIHFFSLLLCWSFRAILHMYISCCRHARSHTPSLSLSPCPLWL